jgi:hypothetical protein
MRAVAFAVAVLSVVATGCSRRHLSPAFGNASRRTFAMQQAIPAREAPPPSMALDTQEAQVIARSYLRGLSGKAPSEPEPVVYLSTQRQAAPISLPPSVPKD